MRIGPFAFGSVTQVVSKMGPSIGIRLSLAFTTIAASGLARRRAPVKILAGGKLDCALTVRAQAFSRAAIEAIRAAGGTTEIVPLPKTRTAQPDNESPE